MRFYCTLTSTQGAINRAHNYESYLENLAQEFSRAKPENSDLRNKITVVFVNPETTLLG